jgi:tetratricopeptide (TPR) repeat protein
VGYNFLRENKVNDALNIFELAMHYYPESVNVYHSYAEALIVAGRKDEAVEVYTKAYELAKTIGHENLSEIDDNLNKLKNNIAIELEGETVPPPPPPQ